MSVARAKCLMLDVDGVLIDGRPEDGRRWDTFLEQDLGLSAELLGRSFFQAEWQEIVVGKKELLPTLAQVLQRIAPDLRAEDLVTYWFERDARVVASVLADVRAAKSSGLPIYLATNQEHLRADDIMQRLKLGEEVDGIFYSARAGCKKPQSAFFAYAQKVAGYEPDALLLVDDTVANVDAARASGWQAAHWDGSVALSDILERHMSFDG